MPYSIEQLTEEINKLNGQALIDSRSPSLPEPIYRGKVRDTYDLGDDRLLMVATDRISTFDCIHTNGIPGKGIILTQMTVDWLHRLNHIVPNHLISADPKDFPEPFASQPSLHGRSMLVKKLETFKTECIVRGYITGSAWSEYKEKGTIAGQPIKQDLVESAQFKFPIFTPSTKAEEGHDQNITLEQMGDLITPQFARRLKDLSLEVYSPAASIARKRGVIIADTKFEFGLDQDGNIVLIDEVLTPDSSRFWSLEVYKPGKSQPSFDKQFVRDWAANSGWDKTPPAPIIPREIVLQTQSKYLEAYKRLFG